MLASTTPPSVGHNPVARRWPPTSGLIPAVGVYGHVPQSDASASPQHARLDGVDAENSVAASHQRFRGRRSPPRGMIARCGRTGVPGPSRRKLARATAGGRSDTVLMLCSALRRGSSLWHGRVWQGPSATTATRSRELRKLLDRQSHRLDAAPLAEGRTLHLFGTSRPAGQEARGRRVRGRAARCRWWWGSGPLIADRGSVRGGGAGPTARRRQIHDRTRRAPTAVRAIHPTHRLPQHNILTCSRAVPCAMPLLPGLSRSGQFDRAARRDVDGELTQCGRGQAHTQRLGRCAAWRGSGWRVVPYECGPGCAAPQRRSRGVAVAPAAPR